MRRWSRWRLSSLTNLVLDSTLSLSRSSFPAASIVTRRPADSEAGNASFPSLSLLHSLQLPVQTHVESQSLRRAFSLSHPAADSLISSLMPSPSHTLPASCFSCVSRCLSECVTAALSFDPQPVMMGACAVACAAAFFPRLHHFLPSFTHLLTRNPSSGFPRLCSRSLSPASLSRCRRRRR